MNKAILESVMKLHADTQADLAHYLGISLSRLNAKINEYRGAQFFQTEIAAIKKRYSLSEKQIDSIFLAKKYLKKTQIFVCQGVRQQKSPPVGRAQGCIHCIYWTFKPDGGTSSNLFGLIPLAHASALAEPFHRTLEK